MFLFFALEVRASETFISIVWLIVIVGGEVHTQSTESPMYF